MRIFPTCLGVPCSRKLGAVVTLVVLFLISLNGSVVANDLESLRRIQSKVDSNFGGIFSWKGEAVSQKTFFFSNPVHPFPNEQFLEYFHNFAFDQRNGNFSSGAVLQKEYSIYNGKTTHLLHSNVSYMRKRGEFYSFHWYNRGMDANTFDGNDFSKTKSDDIDRVAVAHLEPLSPVTMKNFFDPFAKSSHDGKKVTAGIAYIIENMKSKGITDLNDMPATSHSDSIHLNLQDGMYTLDMFFVVGDSTVTVSRVYVFDLKQGSNLVSYRDIQKENMLVLSDVSWKCNYKQIGDFWLPLKTTFERQSNSSGETIKEVIDWKSHEINVPIPEEFFSPQLLGLRRGDILYDERTQQETIISGDEFPPPFHSYDPKNVRHAKTRYVLLTVGIIFIFIALLRMYLRRRASRSGDEK